MTSDDAHQHLHKEEMKARMTADAAVRSKIRHTLQESIDPLDASTHSDGNIVQIVSGRIATDPTVNVHEAVEHINRDDEALRKHMAVWISRYSS